VTGEFWNELHRLLPDADIVLLPPEPPAPPVTADSRLVAAIRARQVREAAQATLIEAWAQLAGSVPRPATVRRTWWAAQPGGQVVQLELIAWQPDVGDPAALLAAARDVIDAASGPVDEERWARASGLRLVTTLADHTVELYGTLDPRGLTATVLGPPLALPPDLGAELTALGTETVDL
jgi:hypothetical protein